MAGPKRLDPYKDSLWRVQLNPKTGKEEKHKSCPSCSKKAGQVVYHTESYFGERDMGNGKIEIQSWCPECRKDKP